MTDTHAPPVPEGAEDLESKGIDVLIVTLHTSTEPAVRGYAAYLLGKAKNPQGIRPLIEALADVDKSVREQAVLALVETGKAAIEPLTAAMNEPQCETRYRAAEALGKLADESVVKPLIQGLQDSRDHVRYMAAKGLTGLGDSSAVDPLIILLKDENPIVRKMTVKALSAMGGKKVQEALKDALTGEKDESVREAIQAGLK